jgi:SulP family sulfate permease
LFGGLPATGAIARTATNIKAGGRTPFAGIFHALFLLLFMLFAMDYVAFIPMAALAAILFFVAWGMSEIRHFIHIFRLSSSDRTVLLLTFFLTILVDLTACCSCTK